jgi:hypothetical protein
MKNLFPIIVPLTYFDIPEGVTDLGNPGLDAFGIIRLLGNDVASLLVRLDDDMIKNVHEDDLAKWGMDRAAGERMALENLSKLAAESSSIRREVTTPASGPKYSFWLGDRFTASCILWPGLYGWARQELESDQLIVSVPLASLMCVAGRGDAEFRSCFKQLLGEMGGGTLKRISAEWFELTPEGIVPFERESP